MKIFEPGDTVYFPEINKPTGYPMTVIGGRKTYYTSGKKYIKYLVEGHAVPPKIVCEGCGKEFETDPDSPDYLEYAVCPHCGARKDFELKDRCGLTDNLAKWIKSTIDNKYDSIIKVVGFVGTGKSNMSVDLATTVDPTFTLEERYVYDILPFYKKLDEGWDEIKPGMCFLMDESINQLNKRRWNSETNTTFGEFLTMFRSLGLILILVMPYEDTFDVLLRETDRARCTITALDLPNGGTYEGRGYYEVSVIMKGGKKVDVCMGTFPMMDLSTLDRYEDLKNGSQRKKLRELIEKLEPKEKKVEEKTSRKDMALWFIIHEGWDYKEVSARFNIPEGTLRRWKKEYLDEKDGL